jgi:phage shock protein A
MIKLFRRMGKYMTALFTGKFNEHADPKIQLEQAIMEAQDQHRRLTEQAANVIANQKQTEMRLNRGMEELETTTGRARQALIMADDSRKKGDEKKAAELERTAEILATKLIQVEKEVESLKNLHLQTSENADNAKRAVQANATALQKKLAERQKLLSQLDQAKMQEQMNTAMASLSATVGQDVPSMEEVRTKIEARYAKALGTSELQGESVETRMLEVEQASVDFEAQGRLSELRSQLGLTAAPEPVAEVTAPAAETAEVPNPGT